MTGKKLLYAAYAAASYTIGMGALLYLMGFVIGAPLPKTVDGGPALGAIAGGFAWNLAITVAFLIPHSVMARPRFKAWWTKLIGAERERATYVLISGLSVFALVIGWDPIPMVIWHVDLPAARLGLIAAYGLGWTTILVATFNIDHFAFFGLRQIWHAIVGRPPLTPVFTARWLYGWVRHPISLGWIVVFWTTPHMSAGHLLLSVVMTLYILIVTPLEEADLVAELGDEYRSYRGKVRRFLPRPPRPARPTSRPGGIS
jgi:protein-S-isoprenylcysteine O-methyltransferase Ste14